MKKWLWIVVIVPVLAAFETIATVGNIDFAYGVTAPRYAEVTESELIHLDNKALAKLSGSMVADHKKMAEWWRSARDTYSLMAYLLLGLVFLFAALLGAVLWQMPSDPALNAGAGHSPPTG